MYTVLLVIHLAISLVLIGIVLLQHGKGADAGAAFGSGASSTVFGARGSASFLGKLTGVLGAGFFVTSLTLAIMAGTFGGGGSVMERFAEEPASSSAPASESEGDGPAPAPEGATAGGRESDAEAPAPPPGDE
ncbi:preprotein translocase subunit SecG [Sediminicurvatus halobius]|uniref:Protein-export membrane protein SecG n=1 Tax=Sediminicurvatus halobius TaxID=2182432 RepID=A0A2U2N4R6_9GAMM|nr:preprotein translocase subunit SecG [Spiribacter halobius]PWG64082.1 preprotein translocase subunit SecG [Spiribacter halobius]UEX76864.1 preprotein translocase subunit SecG [Spiribacter halobius]